MARNAKTKSDSAAEASYKYSGYLSTFLYKPDPKAAKSAASITFEGKDLARWKTLDLDHTIEWRQVPVKKRGTEEAVRIEGDFQDVLAIDSLSQNDPRFWVPFSTVDVDDKRFPIDAKKYPIIEVTYRCTSERAHPTWMWTYEGGSHFGALPKTTEWLTVARYVQHFGFPEKINDVVLRLYSPTRSVESMEISRVRFRAMTKSEREATKKSYASFESQTNPARFPVLDEFMPIGVYMDAESSKRLAEMLGITTFEYWDFVLEDMAKRHHNTIALSNVDHLGADEWEGILSRCEDHGVKIVARHEFPVSGTEAEQRAAIEKSVRPYADSSTIFARTFSGEPIESDFRDVIAAKVAVEEADPNHPVAVVARYPNAYPLFAPFFSASGVGHFTSRQPWDIGTLVRTHAPLSKAQQFWVAAPAFMYPTRTPEWSTCPEMRLMVNLSFANGARGWFAYSYHNDPVWLRGRVQRTLTGSFLTFSDLWLELMQRAKQIGALAPLFLKAVPEESMDDWFVDAVTMDSMADPAPGVGPISRFHLRGSDFSIYMIVSNNVRDMASVNINIPESAASGQEIYDLSDYVTTWNWTPMARRRHVEMFPGQAQVMLVADPDRCTHWRNVISSRLIHDDLRKLRFNLELSRLHGLDVSSIESSIESARGGTSPEEFAEIHRAKAQLTDLVYSSADITLARSKILETSAAICGCDGALCRLMSRGKKDRARFLGEDVVGVARELAALRLELRRGQGAKIAQPCADLSVRALTLLAKIRSEY